MRVLRTLKRHPRQCILCKLSLSPDAYVPSVCVCVQNQAVSELLSSVENGIVNPPFPGGEWLGGVQQAIGMSWYRLRDVL